MTPLAADAAADLRRLRLAPRAKLLLVTHGRGGGTDRHVEELAEVVGDRAAAFVLHPTGGGEVCLRWGHGPDAFRLHFRMPAEHAPLVAVLRAVGIDRVHFHHTLGLDRSLWRLPADLDVAYDFTAHDFYAVCPRVHLFDPVCQRYCGEPDEAGCNRCLRREPRPPADDIRAWRERHRPLLEGAARVLVPSADAAARVRRRFPHARVTVAPHPDAEREGPYPDPRPPSLAGGEALRVVVLGALNPEKGSAVVVAAAEDAARRALPIECHLFGWVYPKPVRDPGPKLVRHGPYRDDDLDRLLGDLRPHLAWFPAQWPETYSYTLSAALRNGLAVAATDLGAFAERLAGRPWSWVRPWQTTPAVWNDFFVSIRLEHQGGSPPSPSPGGGRAPATGFTYRDHYLAPVRPRPAIGDERHLDPAYLAPFARPARGDAPTFAGRLRGALGGIVRKVYYSRVCYPVASTIPLRYRQWLGRKLGRAG